MKVKGTSVDVLTNATEESKFTINATAHAFRILSSDMYQHKIAAIVREITCNAYDSHVTAGKKDVPFKVVLPNQFHPYFEVEDFGEGLDDDGVRNVYATYFKSTKGDSNDVVGAFGLGSKTPFAYTTTFNILARKDGVERLYAAYIGSDGGPCVNPLREALTTEPNGVKITVPVQVSDFNEFRWEAQWVLSFFEVTPIVPGGIDLIFPGIASTLKSDSVVVATPSATFYSSLYRRGTAYAVMGGVCYPLDVYRLSDKLEQRDILNNVLMRNSKACTFIHFNIGELEPAASRETLSMTQETQANLVEGVDRACSQFLGLITQEINSLSSVVEAMKYVYEKFGLLKFLSEKFQYKGVNYSYALEKNLFKTKKPQLCRIRSGHAVESNFRVRFDDFIEGRVKTILYVEPNESVVGLIKHTRQITYKTGGVLVLHNSNEKQIQRWLDLYGFEGIEIVSFKELREQDKTERKKYKSTTKYVKIAKNEVKARYIGTISRNYINPSKVFDLSAGNYLYFNSPSRAYNLDYIGGYTVSMVNLALNLMGMEHCILLALTAGNEKKILKAGIRSVEEVISEWQKENQSKIDLAHLKGKTSVSSKLKEIFEFCKNNEKIQELLATEKAGFTLKEVIESEEASGGVVGGESDEASTADFRPVINEIKLKIEEQYPLLRMYIVSYYSITTEDLKSIKQYIEWVDDKAEKIYNDFSLEDHTQLLAA